MDFQKRWKGAWHSNWRVFKMNKSDIENTTVMVEFIIYGDVFDPHVITNKLEINPTSTTIKGVIGNGKKRPSIDTSWCLGTLKEESFDINQQLNQVIERIKDKAEILLDIKNKYSVNFVFEIVIEIENNEKPAIYFDTEVLNFINLIKAKIDIDLYIYS